MKKILFVTGSMGKGGAERVISILSKHFEGKGYEVSIAMVLHNIISYEIPSKINIINLSSKRGIKKDFIKVIIALRKYLKNEKPDLIVAFMAQNVIITGVAAWGLKIPIIASERIDPSMVKRNYFYKKVLNLIYERCRKIIFQTKRAYNYFPEKVREKGCIIGNPIEITTEKQKDITKNKIVTVGRLVKQKNQSLLIEAFYEINKKYPNYVLVIYGNGPLEKELKEKVKKLGLQDKVFFPGISDNIHKEISDAEIFVLTSNFEGLSNAMLEAMLMGLPVITSDCAGADEIIKEKENGLLFRVGDKEKLIEQIELLINDMKLKEKIGKNAKISAQIYKKENVINEWEKVIESEINLN